MLERFPPQDQEQRGPGTASLTGKINKNIYSCNKTLDTLQ